MGSAISDLGILREGTYSIGTPRPVAQPGLESNFSMSLPLVDSLFSTYVFTSGDG